MDCVACGSAAVTERPERTARGYRRFRCRACGNQYNERSGGLLNHTHYPLDVIALVVLWRLRYRVTLLDLTEMFLVRGIVFQPRGRSRVGGEARAAAGRRTSPAPARQGWPPQPTLARGGTPRRHDLPPHLTPAKGFIQIPRSPVHHASVWMRS
jgi:hypothetical protein